MMPHNPVITTYFFSPPGGLYFLEKIREKNVHLFLSLITVNGDPVEPCENGLRILSWNLDGLSVEKAQNPGVVNVVGNLLTRYHIKIAIIEGIEDPLGLKEVSYWSIE